MNYSCKFFCFFLLVSSTFSLENNKTENKSDLTTIISSNRIESLDDDGKVQLSWTVDESLGSITFEIEAETTGYVGFGISPQGSMLGADIFIAGVFPNGSTYSSDRFGLGFVEPKVDEHSDWKLLEAFEFDSFGKTYLKFSRLLNTCDNEDYPIGNDTIRIIWALGTSDDIKQHTSERRGVRSLNLVGTPMPETNLDGMQNWKMTLDMEMPKLDTSYWCSFYKAPIVHTKHHIVAFDAVLESAEALKHTHHFILFNCYLPADSNKTMDEVFENVTVDKGVLGNHCFDPDEPLPVQYCSEYLYVWAKGGKKMVLPQTVGYPIGEGDEAGVQRYYMLEIHYDNPDMIEGTRFETGVQIYYTNQTRSIDAGLLTVAHATEITLTVPPNVTDFKILGHCSPACTNANLPSDGITIFNALLHSHISGRKLKLRHFRGNVERKWVDFDDHYDFDYQQNKPLADILVLPGDQLTYECTYDSTWKKDGTIVVGGLTTRNEMCQAFVWYYPKVEMDLCGSEYPAEKHIADFGITKFHQEPSTRGYIFVIDEPVELQGPYEESLNTKFKNWTTSFIQNFQETKIHGVHSGYCLSRKTGSYLLEDVSFPENMIEYFPEDVCLRSTLPDTTTPPGDSGVASNYYQISPTYYFGLLYSVYLLL